MKKVFIAANDMVIGGIERSLINFINCINSNDVEITLLLQEKSGKLLNELPQNIKIIEYKPYSDKNILIRKIKNRLKFISFIFLNKNKYDVSICYASYIYLPSIIVRKICKNNYMWIHSDYIQNLGMADAREFFKMMKYNKFKNLVFVSNNALNKYLEYFKKKNQNYKVCHNMINKNEIIEKSDKKIDFNLSSNTLFLNVSRHEEDSKNISLMINACEKLKKDEIEFKLILVGDGPDSDMYKGMVNEKGLQGYVIFLGNKINPCPYYKLADCFILSSRYEGDPMTIYESLTLGMPVISTPVGDVKEYITKENGLIFEQNNVEALYDAMKYFINYKEKFKVNFDADIHNEKIVKTIKEIISKE